MILENKCILGRESGEWFCSPGGISFIFWMQYSCEDKGKRSYSQPGV